MAAENKLQYVSLDYTTHRDALLQRVKARWPTLWNDFLANSFGRVLVDLFAWSTATLAYVIHRIASENFIPTLTLRESAVRLGALVGYKLKGPSAATLYCEVVSVGAAVSATTTLVKGTTVVARGVSGQVVFELAADYTVSAGSSEPRQVILTVSPTASGSNSLTTVFSAVSGKDYIDLADNTVDLTTYVSAGQRVEISDGTKYTITSIESAPDASGVNRLYLDREWEGSTGSTSAVIIERRVKLVQGKSYTEEFELPPTVTANYAVRLSRSPAAEGSVSVSVNGTFWTNVTTLTESGAEAEDYEVRILQDGQVAVVFGDDIFGAIPPSSARVKVDYRVGGGTAGNVPVGSIKTTITGRQTLGQATFQVSNDTSEGVGGEDKESLAKARVAIPAHTRLNNRGVTLGDYETLASQFNSPAYGSVRYARAFANGVNSLLEGNTVTLYVWSAGPEDTLVPASAALKSSLLDYMRTKAVGTDYVTIADGTQRPAPVCIRFKVFTGIDIEDAATSLKAVIRQQIVSMSPGSPLVFSDLVRSLDEVSGVDSLTVATPTTDIIPASVNEVFTPPDDDYEYELELDVVDSFTYSGQLPAYPVAAWCVSVACNGVDLLVVPDVVPGRALLLGDRSTSGIADYSIGLLADRPSATIPGNFYKAVDDGILYRSDKTENSTDEDPSYSWVEVSDGGSYIELATGKIVISFAGSILPVTAKLITAQGYESERVIDLYVSYVGTNSAAQRAAIRSAIRSWNSGLPIGASIFTTLAQSQSGEVTVSASKSNIKDVVRLVPGVTSVSRVALESPGNSNSRLTLAAGELARFGNIVLNGTAN